jgi:hypothetical protein
MRILKKNHQIGKKTVTIVPRLAFGGGHAHIAGALFSGKM